MPTFAQIQAEIENMLDIPDEQLTEEQKDLMQEYLIELGNQESEKVDAFAGFIRKQTAIADAMKKESDHLANKARSVMSKIDRLKKHYLGVMREHGLKKINGDVYSIGVRESSRVNVYDIQLLKGYNPEYVREEIEYKPDKIAIKAAIINNGVSLPGCSLEKSYSLNIR